MRILAAHDAAGNIHEVVLSPAGAPPATITTETGLSVTEVKAPAGISKTDLSDPDRSRRQLEKLSRQLQELRVEVGKAELVPKKKKKS